MHSRNPLIDWKSFLITCRLISSHWIWSIVSSFSLAIGCGSIFARALPNMPHSSLMATGQPLHVFVCLGKTSLFKTEVILGRCLLVAVELWPMCCHTRVYHPSDTGHGTPPRHSIETRSRLVVVLSIDVCSHHYFSFMKVLHNAGSVQLCIIILENQNWIHCSNTKKDYHWL